MDAIDAEILEDLHDLAVIAERREEPTVPFEEVKKNLKASWALVRSSGNARTNRTSPSMIPR